MQIIWIALYVVMGLATVVGILSWVFDRCRRTFGLPPTDGDVLYAEKYRFVAVDSYGVSLRSNIVFTSDSILVCPCALFYKDRLTFPRLFQISLDTIKAVTLLRGEKFNVQLLVEGDRGVQNWKFSFEAPERVEHLIKLSQTP